MPDVYQGSLVSELRDLRRRVEELEALLKARPALTAASQGWLLTNMSIPSVAAGTVHIGANGGDFFAQTTSGTKRMFLQAAAIANQANFISGDIAGTPTATQYNNLRADAVATRQYGFDLTTRLRTAGVIAT
ncbi:hypothetical protein [Nonomuraea sp. NPDC049141]|uniref:hypothetical protein n=1 Tax=Nonomuraea sp. NPDC049141 TaxID=3155500 RepID=UPI0033E21D0F